MLYDKSLDEMFMRQAIDAANEALINGEVPVGCVLVSHDLGVVVSAYNLVERYKDPTAHAEIVAIRKASKLIGDWRLNGFSMYCTLEPCCMCCSAAVLARLDKIVWGAKDIRIGGVETILQITSSLAKIWQVNGYGGVFADECSSILKSFFKKRRESNT